MTLYCIRKKIRSYSLPRMSFVHFRNRYEQKNMPFSRQNSSVICIASMLLSCFLEVQLQRDPVAKLKKIVDTYSIFHLPSESNSSKQKLSLKPLQKGMLQGLLISCVSSCAQCFLLPNPMSLHINKIKTSYQQGKGRWILGKLSIVIR